jgi:integrase
MDRIDREIVGTFGDRELRSLTREELQQFLNDRSTMSFSTVDHLKWDLRQIFKTAIAETDFITKNPATLLQTPSECPKPVRRVMTLEEVILHFSVLPLRERLIEKFKILAGMRPGEIYALRRKDIKETAAAIEQRVYRGVLGPPKTGRWDTALPSLLQEDLAAWIKLNPSDEPDAWLFPSENGKTPVRSDNVRRRNVRPKLKAAGLEWVDGHVLRRSHSSLLKVLGADQKAVSDQQGHGLDVHMNVYAQTPIDKKLEAVELLATALKECGNNAVTVSNPAATA